MRKVLLILVGVIVSLVILVAGVIGYDEWRFEHAASADRDNSASTGSSGGAVSPNTTEKLTPSELGTDIYPGAEPGKVGNMHVNTASGSMVSASYLTPDSREQVIRFYKSRFGDQATLTDMGPSVVFTLKKNTHEQVTVTVAQDAGQAGGKTQIRIIHTTDNQAR